MNVKTISIFGVTGSIGQNTLDLVLSAPECFDVYAVTANSNVKALADAAGRMKAKVAVISDERYLADLQDALSGSGIKAEAGRTALIEAAGAPVDIHMAAIVGMAGLEPLLAAVKTCKVVAIANKEPLVAAGEIVLGAAQESGAKILPVDSEHNAIFQVFEEHNRRQIERIILTASGGPFRTWSSEEMRGVSVEQAVAHPNWSMGAKISVDSASMMNKALEVIEARYLFTMPPEKIDVVVHPQSVIHSMVQYSDGSILSQMGASDMRTPIAYALGWPERMATSGQVLDFKALSRLDFEEPDTERFPALMRAYECLRGGASSCLALNAANEMAVDAFLKREIGFLDIIQVIDKVLESGIDCDLPDLKAVLECDALVRKRARGYIGTIATSFREG